MFDHTVSEVLRLLNVFVSLARCVYTDTSHEIYAVIILYGSVINTTLVFQTSTHVKNDLHLSHLTFEVQYFWVIIPALDTV